MIIDLHDQVTISPALPLRRVATYNASALPLELINIPDAFGDAELTGVGVSIVNADGLENSAPCVRRGDQWRVAFAASCLLTYGFVERGVKVTVSVREDSVDRDIVLGVGDLEVMRSAPSAEPGDPSKGYVTKGSDRFDKSKVVDGVQHFVKQTMEYDEEMHAWGATWTGDYILEDGEFIPYEAPTGGGVTTAAVALALLLAPFVTSAITATKEYVDRKDGEVAAAATNYTDSAISQIPAPDFSPSNATLVATIEETSPAPGDYATVSNKAMTALQEHQDISGKLDKSGDTMTGLLKSSAPLGESWDGFGVNGIIGYYGGIHWGVRIGTGANGDYPVIIGNQGNEIVVPSSSGTMALAAPDPTAGNLAALDADGNPTDSLIPAANVALKTDISPTSPAFSNAVLSVGLGIDTNTVAVINELVDSAHDLPVTGATSVGALLLALAAAVAALKKKFGYDTEDSAASATIALSTRTFPVVDATAKTSADTIAVTMPSSAADGKVSDLCLRIDTGASVPALTFDLSANVFIPASGDDAWGTLEASSHNIFSFTSSGTQTVAVTDAANGNAVTNVTKRVWIVGRVTAAIVAAETINES